MPTAWLGKAAFARHLLPFCLTPELTDFLLPLDEGGRLEEEPEKMNPLWEELDFVWREGVAGGEDTPQTLVARLDHYGAISSQLPLAPVGEAERACVAYSKSGTRMRASRFSPRMIIENGLYRWKAGDEEEAAYLVALLNAPTLIPALEAAKTSPRHFDLNPWKKIPYPRFNRWNPDHVRLAELACEAEKTAETWLAAQPRPLAKQGALSNGIRAELAGQGVFDEIDGIVRVLLPEQAR